MKVSRRELGAMLTAAAVAPAQTPDAPQPDDLAVQREHSKRNQEALAKLRISETLEPSFLFKP